MISLIISQHINQSIIKRQMIFFLSLVEHHSFSRPPLFANTFKLIKENPPKAKYSQGPIFYVVIFNLFQT